MAAEGEFGVVVPPAGGFEDGADVVAEVAFDFEDERGRPLLRVPATATRAIAWAKGRMQAEVLPVPMAPKMATPVYRPARGA